MEGDGVRYAEGTRWRAGCCCCLCGSNGHVSQSGCMIDDTVNKTNLFWIDTSDNGMPVLALTRRVMIHAQLLRNQMHDPPLLRAQRPREGELVPHRIILEQQDPRVYLQRRRIVQIELVRRALDAGRTRRHCIHRLRRRRVGLNAVLVRHRHRRGRRVLLRAAIRRGIARRERALRGERRGHDRPKVVVRRLHTLLRLLLVLRGGRLLLELLLLELHGAHAPDRLFALDALLFALLEDFFCIRHGASGLGRRSR